MVLPSSADVRPSVSFSRWNWEFIAQMHSRTLQSYKTSGPKLVPWAGFLPASLSLHTSSTERRGPQPYDSGGGKRDSHPHHYRALFTSHLRCQQSRRRQLGRAAYPTQSETDYPKIQISRSCGHDWWSCAVLHGGSGKWVLTPLQPHFLCTACCTLQSTNEHSGNAAHFRTFKPYAMTLDIEAQPRNALRERAPEFQGVLQARKRVWRHRVSHPVNMLQVFEMQGHRGSSGSWLDCNNPMRSFFE